MHGYNSVDQLSMALRNERYLIDEGLGTVTYLALKLRRPLLLEGEPGVGKTELAKALASAVGTPLIRLQCYEGINVHTPSTTGTTRASCCSCAPAGRPSCTPRSSCCAGRCSRRSRSRGRCC